MIKWMRQGRGYRGQGGRGGRVGQVAVGSAVWARPNGGAGLGGGWGLGAGLGWAAGWGVGLGCWRGRKRWKRKGSQGTCQLVGLQGGLVLLPSTLLLLQGDDLAQGLSGWSGCGGGLSAPGWGAGLGAGLGGWAGPGAGLGAGLEAGI